MKGGRVLYDLAAKSAFAGVREVFEAPAIYACSTGGIRAVRPALRYLQGALALQDPHPLHHLLRLLTVHDAGSVL